MTKLNKMFGLNKVNAPHLPLLTKSNKQSKNLKRTRFNMVGIDGKPKIDSICVWIPVKHLELKNEHRYVEERYTRYLEKYIEKYVGFSIERDGIKTYLNKVLLTIKGKKVVCLEVNLLAKHLGAKYFEGINRNNIGLVLSYINSLNSDFYIPLDAILEHGKVINLDICKDIVCSYPWTSLNGYINALWSKAIENGFKPLKPRLNHFYKNGANSYTGIQFMGRESKKKTFPPFKGYSKSFDLYTNSHDFYEKFLKDVGFDMDNVFRLEGTLKSSNLKSFFPNRELGNILEDGSIIDNAFNDMFNRYLRKGDIEQPRKEKQVSDLSTNDMIHIQNLKYRIEYESLPTVIDSMVLLILDKRTKKRTIKRLHQLYNDYIFEGKINGDIDTFYKDLNI